MAGETVTLGVATDAGLKVLARRGPVTDDEELLGVVVPGTQLPTGVANSVLPLSMIWISGGGGVLVTVNDSLSNALALVAKSANEPATKSTLTVPSMNKPVNVY